MENFGKIGTDKVTGFVGVITAKCYYVYGCAQYCLTPPIDKDGKIQDGQWFDEGRIAIGDVVFPPESVKTIENGCEFREHP